MSKHTAFYLTLSVVLLSASAAPSLAEDATPAGTDMVWEGYLFRDEKGRVRLGWPVIAMGVMAMPSHVVEGDITARLTPLLTDVNDNHVFWNYDLERRGDGALTGLPRALVRLRGRVTLERPADPNLGTYQGGTRTMHDARLLDVEFLHETWLRRWGQIFRDPNSPFRIDLDRGTITDEELAGFAKKALPLLASMRSAPASGERERDLARSIDPESRVVDTHRRRSEWDLQRWVVTFAGKHADLVLEGIDSLPTLPPSSMDLQRLFLASPTKRAFLKGVRADWSGPLSPWSSPAT